MAVSTHPGVETFNRGPAHVLPGYFRTSIVQAGFSTIPPAQALI
jgi:hypothetical protein